MNTLKILHLPDLFNSPQSCQQRFSEIQFSVLHCCGIVILLKSSSVYWFAYLPFALVEFIYLFFVWHFSLRYLLLVIVNLLDFQNILYIHRLSFQAVLQHYVVSSSLIKSALPIEKLCHFYILYALCCFGMSPNISYLLQIKYEEKKLIFFVVSILCYHYQRICDIVLKHCNSFKLMPTQRHYFPYKFSNHSKIMAMCISLTNLQLAPAEEMLKKYLFNESVITLELHIHT